MKHSFILMILLTSFSLQAFEYEVQIENSEVTVSKILIQPGELIGLHRDVYPQVVIALQGGTITRLEADGTETDVEFPTGTAIFRPRDPPELMHGSVNRCIHPVELIVVQLKNNFLFD